MLLDEELQRRIEELLGRRLSDAERGSVRHLNDIPLHCVEEARKLRGFPRLAFMEFLIEDSDRDPDMVQLVRRPEEPWRRVPHDRGGPCSRRDGPCYVGAPGLLRPEADSRWLLRRMNGPDAWYAGQLPQTGSR